MIRPSGFSPTRVMARQFALCRKCPRGFEGPVVLLWKEIPVCQSCYIKELEAWNAKLNEIHGQQTKPNPSADGKTSDASRHDGSGCSPEDSACIPVRDKTVDTSQGVGALSATPETSRPGIHGPQETEVSGAYYIPEIKGSGNASEMSRTVDTEKEVNP